MCRCWVLWCTCFSRRLAARTLPGRLLGLWRLGRLLTHLLCVFACALFWTRRTGLLRLNRLRRGSTSLRRSLWAWFGLARCDLWGRLACSRINCLLRLFR